MEIVAASVEVAARKPDRLFALSAEEGKRKEHRANDFLPASWQEAASEHHELLQQRLAG